MTTATGEYAFNFNGQANENPWVEAGITVRSGGTTRIDTNVLRPNTTTIFAYTGGTYDGGPVETALEVNASAVDDECLLGALDENGDGFLLEVRPTTVFVLVLDNYVVVDSNGTASITLAADDLFTFRVVKGSPNSYSATRNGSAITLSATTYALALGTLEAVWSVKAENVGTAAAKSLAVVDGLVVASATPRNMLLLGVG